MGVFGLTTYVSDNSTALLRDYKLCNCNVLIDGNSIASILYGTISGNHALGGDYDRYAHAIQQFIGLLRRCSVRACYVFDGAYEYAKLKTVLERLKLNVVICGQYRSRYRVRKTFPLLVRDVCRAVLLENGECIVQCDYEADQELIVLARRLGWPIISNDSDFYLCDSGYIPLSQLELRTAKDKKHGYYIKCKRYDVDVFLSHLGGLEDRSLLPLLSCLLGNDYIAPNTFGNFLGMSEKMKMNDRLEKIFTWLRGVIFIEVAIDKMMEKVPKSKRKRLRSIIGKIVADYNRNSSCSLKYINDFYHNQPVDEQSLQDNVENKQNETSDANCEYSLNQTTMNDTVDELYDSDIELIDCSEFDIVVSDSDIEDNVESEFTNNTTISCNMEQLVQNINSSTNAVNVLSDLDENEIFKNRITNSDEESDITNTNKELECPKNVTPRCTDAKRRGENLDNTKNTRCENSIDVCKETMSNRENKILNIVPDWLLEKFRLCLISPNIMNIFRSQRIIILSQSENYRSKPSHEIALPILRTICGLLLNGRTNVEVKCHSRVRDIIAGRRILEPIFRTESVPTFPSLCSMPNVKTDIKMAILMDTLKLPLTTDLSNFPNDWCLFAMAFAYWVNNCKDVELKYSHVRAVVICWIHLNVIDKKIGYARQMEELCRLKKNTKLELKKSVGTFNIEAADVLRVENSCENDKNISGILRNIDKNLETDSGETSKLDESNDYYIQINTKDISNVITDNTNHTTVSDTEHVPHTEMQSIQEDCITTKSVLQSIENLDSVSTNKTTNDLCSDQSVNTDILNVSLNNMKDASDTSSKTVIQSLNSVTKLDCILAAESLLKFHEFNNDLLENRKSFNVKLVHAFAQLQHCVQSVSMLNSILDFPFPSFRPHSFLSGTMLYNLYGQIDSPKSTDGYVMKVLLGKASTLMELYRSIMNTLDPFIPFNRQNEKKTSNKKKPRRKARRVNFVDENDDKNEENDYDDSENLYSLLAKLEC